MSDGQRLVAMSARLLELLHEEMSPAEATGALLVALGRLSAMQQPDQPTAESAFAELQPGLLPLFRYGFVGQRESTTLERGGLS